MLSPTELPRTDFWFLLLLVTAILELIVLILCYRWASKCQSELEEYKNRYQRFLNQTNIAPAKTITSPNTNNPTSKD